MIRTFEIYAGMAGFPDDSTDTYKAQHNSYNSARSAALVMLSNPYTWVRVLDGDSGALMLDLMAEHHARVH